MAFKTKEEMFGDGGGYGAAVPYSTTNPPGTGAGNRGVQFGEQVTAAISNRAHYALALNDEDLNARVVIYETDGLDATYDLGTAAIAGGGRVINKDAGAVEAVSAHATTLGDTENDHALFRANTLADTVGIAIGFDFLDERVGASGQTGNDAAAGFLDRRIFAQAAGDTILTDSVAATLNPGGALATTVRVSAGQLHTGGLATDVLLGVDLVEVMGGTAYDGLYVLGAPGGADTDMTVVRLDASVPAFAANTACTIRVVRPQFATWGTHAGAGRLTGTAVAGAPLILIPGAVDSADTLGSQTALEMWARTALAPYLVFDLDLYGRANFGLARGVIPTALDQNVDGGSYATRRDVTGNGDIGHIVRSEDATLTARHDFVSLMPIDPAGLAPAVTPNTVTMAFVAASPGTGELRFNAAQDSDLWGFTPAPGTYIEINGVYGGLYFILERTTTGNGGFLLRCMDGTVPTHFPAAGTCTLTALYSASVLGRMTAFAPTSLLDPGEAGITVRAGNVMTAPTLENGVALALFGSLTDTDFLRCFVPSSGVVSGPAIVEKFKVSQTGAVFAAGGATLGGNVEAAGSFSYSTPPSRITPISLFGGVAVGAWSRATDPTTDLFWQSAANSAYITFPLSAYLRDGQVITDVKLIVDPGSARAGADRVRLLLCYSDPDFATAAVPTVTATIAEYDDASTTRQIVSLAAALGAGHTVDRLGSNGREYFLAVKAGNDGGTSIDIIYGLELTYTDPGPRSV